MDTLIKDELSQSVALLDFFNAAIEAIKKSNALLKKREPY